DNQRARLHAAHRLEVVVPGEAECLHILIVDKVERAEALLAPPAAVTHPVADVGGRIDVAHRLAVDHCGCRILCCRSRHTQRDGGRHGQRRARKSPARPLIHSSVPSRSSAYGSALVAKEKPGRATKAGGLPGRGALTDARAFHPQSFAYHAPRSRRESRAACRRIGMIEMRQAGALAAALVLAACAANSVAREPSDIAIDGERVHPESIASDAAGTIYIGSVPGIVYRASPGDAAAKPWIVPDDDNGLTSLFGVLADDTRGLLWVCNNPPFGGPPQPGAASSLKAFDLATGALSASYAFPGQGPFTCNDIAVARDGTTYATDTSGGRIFALAPRANELALFAADPELVGIDGIAFSGDGTMYINNVRANTVQRVDRSGGAYAGLTTLALSEPVSGPDALRPVSGNRFLQAEGSGNRVTYVDIDGDRAVIT